MATWSYGAGLADCLLGKTRCRAWGQSLCPRILGSWAPVKRLGSPNGPKCRVWAPGSSQHPSHLRNDRNEHAQGWRQENSWPLPPDLLPLGTSLESGRMSHFTADSDLSLSIWWQLSGLQPPDTSRLRTFAEPERPRQEKSWVLCIALHSISIGKLILFMKAQKN